MDKDLDLLLDNLENCLAIANELHKIDPTDESLFQIILNNSIITENAFTSSRITQFLISTWSLLKAEPRFSSFYQVYIDKFLKTITESDEKNTVKFDFIKMLNFNRNSFRKLVDMAAATTTEIDSNMFELLTSVLVRHQAFVFENDDLNLLEKLNALSIKHTESINLLDKCLRLSLSFLANNEYSLADQELKSNLISLLIRSFKYRCSLFRDVVVEVSAKNKLPKNLKKFASENEYLSAKFKSCLSENAEDVYNSDDESKSSKNAEDYTSLIGTSDIQKLLSQYTYTLSKKDVSVLKRLAQLDPKLDCLIFKAKVEATGNSSDILNRQTKLADFIASKLDEAHLDTTIHNYPLSRKLENMGQFYETKDADLNAKIYDPVYLLPNMYNLLDYGKFDGKFCQFEKKKLNSKLYIF
jgi:hypothetical protein